MKLVHLVKRFAGSLGSRPPADETWATEQLLPGERDLWARMSVADRRHAVDVAHAIGDVPRPVVAAALLHDVGKIESGLGTFGRVGATVLGMLDRDRWGGRVRAYLHHDEIGAELLAGAGSDALTVAWAREHHLPEARWSIPVELGRALKAADDD